MIKPDPTRAIELVNSGVSVTAYKVNAEGRKVPWAKDWPNLESLPLTDEHGIMRCIEEGCHGFQMRAIDAGLCVIDLDVRENKDGRKSFDQELKLHGIKLPKDFFTTGYVVQTPNDGYHIYLKADEHVSNVSKDGILLGVDLICNRKKLVVIEGSTAPNKITGEYRHYLGSGHIYNSIPIPPDLSKMFITIIRNEERMREEQKEKRLHEAMQRQKSRASFEGGSIFEEANRRIGPALIESLFHEPGAYWKDGKNGPEYYTLNPTRQDNHIGSFSIRHDGVYSDFSDNHSDAGDFITLVERALNMKPYDAACMIIKNTGGNPDDYKGKMVAPKLTIGKPVAQIEAPKQKEEFIDDDPFEQAPDAPKEEKKSALFPLKRLGEMSLEEEEWLVDRLFQGDSLALTYGKPGSGKSFWTLDISLCIATGKSFHGNDVKQGPVVYMAGEGHKGIYKRALAWQKHYGIDAQNAPWWLAGKPFDLIDEMSVESVLTAIDHHTHGIRPSLVVIDTLARNFGPGDENKTSDMGMVIRNADAIRVKYGCLVIIVHHSGHDSDRARGSSALKAAMDFEYCVSQPEENILFVTNTRMKDGEKPADMNYRLTDILLGKQHKWGSEMKSAVLVEEEIDQGSKTRKRTEYLGKTQKHVLDTLVMMYDERVSLLKEELMDTSKAAVSKSELVEKCAKSKTDHGNIYKIIKELVSKGLVKEDGNDIAPLF